MTDSNTNFNIDAIFEQIEEELRYDKVSGKGYASIRATARLANVDPKTLRDHFQSAGGENPSKLAKILIGQGFKPGVFSTEGVPDVAVAMVVKYYAWMAGKNCNDYAKAMDCALSSVSIRMMIQNRVGEPAVKRESIEDFVRKQLPEIAATWEVRFEKEFWLALENLYGLNKKRRACALFINAHIYNYFPCEVRKRLDEINPILESGYRSKMQHQHFDGVLLEALQKHIRQVTINLMSSKTRLDFKKLMKKIPKLSFSNPTMLPGGDE